MTQHKQSISRIPHRVDAHHHLWRYRPDEFGWINGEMNTIRRDFLTHDLKPLLDSAGISGTIAVQARQSLEETHWLLGLADDDASAGSAGIKGVVGWAPIAAADFQETFESLRRCKKLRGLRHVIQDEPDDQFILSRAFNRGIRMLRDTGLVYDILIHARHLPQTLRFVDMHPGSALRSRPLCKAAHRGRAAGTLEHAHARAGEASQRKLQALRPALPRPTGISGRQPSSNHIGA